MLYNSTLRFLDLLRLNKENVYIISSDSPFYWKQACPTHNSTLETLSDQEWMKYHYCFDWLIILSCGFADKVTCEYMLHRERRKMKENARMFKIEKCQYIPHCYSDRCVKDTVVI